MNGAKYICCLFWLICCLAISPIIAQPPVDLEDLTEEQRELLSQLYDMTLEELEELKSSGRLPSELEKVINSLLGVTTSRPSKKTFSTRDAPSIVTLITEEEIRNLGARDLIDVLRLVPGYHFALDQEGQVGLGIRGNWANEGKVLLMIDGQEMNDIYSATLAFGHHYPVDLIERIEVIRGPGSAIYGGFAEYGVINIVTKEPDGIKIGGSRGQWFDSGDKARQNQHFYIGNSGPKGRISLSYYGGQGQRSEGLQLGYYRYTGLQADSLGLGRQGSLSGNSTLNPRFFNFHLQSRGFHLRNITDLYEVTDVTTIDTFGNRPITHAIRSNYTELRYDIKLFKQKLTLSPRANLIIQAPTVFGHEDTSIVIPRFNQLTARARLNFTFDYNITHRINFTGGAETFSDLADYDVRNDVVAISDSFSIRNAAIFGQLILRTPFGNITGGARYDYNEAYGEALVPRIALTKRFKRFHFKLLGSAAFRAPSIGNVALAFDGTYDISDDSTKIVNIGREISPERSLVFEAELGYQLSKDAILTANVFHIRTENPIVYHFYQDETIKDVFGADRGLFVYQNFPSSGSYGLELDFRYKQKWGYVYANYSYYSTKGMPQPVPYTVSNFNYDPELRVVQNDGLVLGFPQHKINLNACFYLHDNLSFNLSGNWLSERYAYDMIQNGPGPFDYEGVLTKSPSTFLVNANLRHQHFIVKGLDVSVGIHDLFNQQAPFLQPYFGLNVPMQGPSRELYLKASWDISFKKKE